MKHITPSIKLTAFNCAYCDALSTQHWFEVYTYGLNKDRPLPHIVESADEYDLDIFKDNEEAKENYLRYLEERASGTPILRRMSDSQYVYHSLDNVHISSCFNCEKVSIWIHNRLIYPKNGPAPSPNVDLPEDVLRDYREASEILDLSPRGAAALMRLCIQKLCKHLGKSGKNLNEDIGALVAEGLDRRIQQALDAVRVIGNNAVHPGAMDLTDDRATAESLFRLLNMIAERMISEPKHVNEMYSMLPKSALDAIESRDRKSD